MLAITIIRATILRAARMNLDHPIVSSDGNRYYAVGGKDSVSRREYRGYYASFEYVDGHPTLLMWSVLQGHDSGAFGIYQCAAHKYTEWKNGVITGTPTEYCVSEAIKSLPVLGKPVLACEVKTLVDCIMHWIPELLGMKPCPDEIRKADRPKPIWEITHKDQSGKVLSEASI